MVLLDNGNLRVIWDDDEGNRFGFQFFGSKRLAVMFRAWQGATLSMASGANFPA